MIKQVCSLLCVRRLLLVVLPAVLPTLGLGQSAHPQVPGETMHKSDVPTVQQLAPDVSPVGQGLFRYLFWRVYEAQLLAPEGVWQNRSGYETPFVLRLTYLRDLLGEAIAERSVEEMRKQGFNDDESLAHWLKQMKTIFPDVGNGTRLTGVHVPGVGAYFFEDDRYLGLIADTQFSQKFFNIWLSEKTTGPDLRRELLGL